jgi:small subunit ribosomal protein S16
MVRIRLRRVGSKKQPTYRIVITDSKSPRDGRFIERIGFYNPRTQPATIRVDENRALYWLSVGAQPSDAVRHMMGKVGTMERYDRLRKGEGLEALVAEAQAEDRPAVDPRTRRDDIKPKPKKPKAGAAAAEAQPAGEAPAEAVAEAAVEEAPVEAVAEAAVEEAPVEPAAEETASEGAAEAPAE